LSKNYQLIFILLFSTYRRVIIYSLVVESTRTQLRPRAGAPRHLRQPSGHPLTSSELARLMEDAHDWQTKSGLGHSLKLTLASLPRECRSSFCRNCDCCDLQRGNGGCLADVPTTCRPQRLEHILLYTLPPCLSTSTSFTFSS